MRAALDALQVGGMSEKATKAILAVALRPTWYSLPITASQAAQERTGIKVKEPENDLGGPTVARTAARLDALQAVWSTDLVRLVVEALVEEDYRQEIDGYHYAGLGDWLLKALPQGDK